MWTLTPPLFFGGGIEPPTKFSKMGGLKLGNFY